MRKFAAKAIAVTLTAALALTGCGNGSGTDGGTGGGGTGEGSTAANADAITDLVYPRLSTREIENFNFLNTERGEDYETLTNLVDPLLEVDPYGKLKPGIAEEWGSEDNGKTWTFKIREGVKWVDMNGEEKADCTSQDWVTSLEWVLNFHKNDSMNTSMPLALIEGAQEYYDYTKGLSEEEALALTPDGIFLDMVGIEAPDANTLIYTCIEEMPYFESVASSACLYPLCQGMIDELGGVEGVRAMNNTNMWYNGCYTLTNYIMGNEKTFTRNPLYWDTDCTLFDTVTVKMVESNDVAYQLYQAGEIDYVDLTESNINTIYGDEGHEFHDYLVGSNASKYAYQYHFNFNKNKEDGTPDTNWNTAIANKNFRLAWYYGLDLKEYYKRTNAINPMLCESNFYTNTALCYTSDGTDYTELVREKLGLPQPDGETMTRVDKAKAEECKKKAIEELTALGVTFPVEIDYYISSKSQTALDSANVLKQVFSDCLGDDFVVLNIKTYLQSINSEVVTPGYHSIVNNGWGADYGDPHNTLFQETYGNDNAYYSKTYSKINSVTEETEANKELLDTYKHFTELEAAANAITDDMDARYDAFAEAEAYLISNAIVIPSHYNPGWSLTKINPYSRINGKFGAQNEKMKNWETNKNGYTTAQAEELKAAFEAGKSAANEE